VKRSPWRFSQVIERALNAFWILLGAAAAASAWTLGLVGPSGPESGLFPLIAALIVMAAGIVLVVRSPNAPQFPRGTALLRVAGVVGGLAFMALALPHAGFAVTGALAMVILVRTAGDSSWPGAIVLALGSVAVVMWLFGQVLGMALPRGPWGW
jgi:putative tricarboxylic transport membrane protein